MVRLYSKTTELCAEREHFAKPAACYTAPTFTGAPYTFTVAEYARVGTAVGTVNVTFPSVATTTVSIISGGDPFGPAELRHRRPPARSPRHL